MEPFTTDIIDSIYHHTIDFERPDVEAITNTVNEIIHIDQHHELYSSTISSSRYEKFIIFSDIHGDLLTLFLTLIEQDIISFEGLNKADIISNCLRNYETINIFSEYLSRHPMISDKYHNTCLIILGDIVDAGRRVSGVLYECRNPYGLNELGIHILLYNLRILFKQHNGDVIILYGNHEFMTLINNEGRTTGNGNNYMDIETREFYSRDTDWNTIFTLREKILMPFYLVDNSLFKIIVDERDNNILYFLSHGSASFNTKFPIKMNNFNVTTLTNIFNFASSQILNSFTRNLTIRFNDKEVCLDGNVATCSPTTIIYSLLWSRNFANAVDDTISCDTLQQYIPNSHDLHGQSNIIFIMGHCTTDFMAGSLNHSCLNHNDGRTISSRKECIFGACPLPSNHLLPQVIFVDNALATQNSQSTRRLRTVLGKQRSRLCITPPLFTEILILSIDIEINPINIFLISRSNFNRTDFTGSYQLYNISPPEQGRSTVDYPNNTLFTRNSTTEPNAIN